MKHLAMIKPNATLNKVVKDSKQLTNNFPKKDNPVIMGSSNKNLSSINKIKKYINVFFEILLKLTSITNAICSVISCTALYTQWPTIKQCNYYPKYELAGAHQ